MEIKNIKREDGKLSFQVLVDAAAFEAAVNKAYLKAKKSIYVPGFRKGKAPRMVIEGMYGAKVFYDDAVDSIALDAFKAGMEEAKDRTVGDPAITKYDVDDAKCLTIDFETALYPEVTLGQYKGLEAEKESDKVSAADVNAEIESVRKRNARIVTVDRKAKMGDTVNLDYDGYKDGVRFDGGKDEGHDLVLGSHSFVPGFEEQIVGMAAGDEKDIDITFPENYHEGLAGAAVVFKIKVNEVKESQLPALDDEFAKDVSEFDTLEEYKADVRANLQKSRDDQAENAFRSLIMKQAADNMSVEIPQVMLAEKAEEIVRNYAANFGMTDRSVPMDKLLQMMGLDRESMNMTIMPAAEFQVKQDLLIDAVVKAENLSVSDEEAEEYVKKVAEGVNASVEEIKQYFGAEYIAREKKREKATEIILSSAVVGEAPAAAEEKAEEKAEETPAE